MANQGNGTGIDQLQQLEAAITAARPKPRYTTSPEAMQPYTGTPDGKTVPYNGPAEAVDAGTIVAFAEALAERVTAAGRYAREHGAYIDEVSIAFAKQLQAEAEQYAASLLASERRKMDELQKIMGKTEP